MNAVIGSGIFLLPGKAAELLGPAAIVALLIAGVFSLLLALCFAEAGARFSGTGAAYIYAESAFGPFVGFQVGWISWVVRLISWAALANGFALALLTAVGLDTEQSPALVPTIAASALVALAFANVLGARVGAGVIKLFTVAKLLPLAIFLGVGVLYAGADAFVPFAPQGWDRLGETTLLVLWAYAGFEQTAVVAGETRDPQRTVPLALLSVMGVVLLIYLGTFAVAQGTYPGMAGSDAPIAEAATTFLGSAGALLIAVGIAVSVFGTTSGTALIAPRMVFALSERGQLPPWLSQLHARYGTPVPAIVLTTTISVAIAVSGTFAQLALISVVARFAQFIPTCFAILVFRRRDRLAGAASPGFRVPGGPVIPLLTAALCLALLAQAPTPRLLAGGAAILSGVPIYALWTWRSTGSSTSA
ncbi:MAG: APC family permease [Myxococcales bacterium]|nr:APC family permease [Myxococcales bacterium]